MLELLPSVEDESEVINPKNPVYKHFFEHMGTGLLVMHLGYFKASQKIGHILLGAVFNYQNILPFEYSDISREVFVSIHCSEREDGETEEGCLEYYLFVYGGKHVISEEDSSPWGISPSDFLGGTHGEIITASSEKRKTIANAIVEYANKRCKDPLIKNPRVLQNDAHTEMFEGISDNNSRVYIKTLSQYSHTANNRFLYYVDGAYRIVRYSQEDISVHHPFIFYENETQHDITHPFLLYKRGEEMLYALGSIDPFSYITSYTPHYLPIDPNVNHTTPVHILSPLIVRTPSVSSTHTSHLIDQSQLVKESFLQHDFVVVFRASPHFKKFTTMYRTAKESTGWCGASNDPLEYIIVPRTKIPSTIK